MRRGVERLGARRHEGRPAAAVVGRLSGFCRRPRRRRIDPLKYAPPLRNQPFVRPCVCVCGLALFVGVR